MSSIALKTVAVNPDKQALADLRAQIDRLDGMLHDLLRDRAELIDQVRKLKGKQHIYIRPGREEQFSKLMDRTMAFFQYPDQDAAAMLDISLQDRFDRRPVRR